MFVPSSRIRRLCDASPRAQGQFVVYWMMASRRLTHNFALQHAVQRANEANVPLLILEALSSQYPYASDRFHAFVIDGMAEHEAATGNTAALYFPYIEPQHGAGRGLVAALAERAVEVVTDDWPMPFVRTWQQRVAKHAGCRMVAVDSNHLLPLSATPKAHVRAHDFRRFFQKTAAAHLSERPVADPLAHLAVRAPASVPADILRRWPRATAAELQKQTLARLPIDHSVAPVAETGGTTAARARWARFRSVGLRDYGEGRRTLDPDGSSALSPWLHFGHIGVHELLADIVTDHGPLSFGKVTGSREGWWGLPPGPEGFLDELVTWREVGHHFQHHTPDAHTYASLPAWARETMEEHLGDPRPTPPSKAALEAGRSPDPVWNIAQRQLVETGRMHNYLRMMWGKKMFEWTAHPADAMALLFELNDKYALDGRDPNSMCGISWVFGRFDRAWGPERPIFGKIRYMTSENTAKKVGLGKSQLSLF